jgi:quercetin dioxygenase-like cupin family protein
MGKLDLQNPNRRKFLRTVPVAAAATIALTDASMFSSIAEAQAPRGRGQRPSFDGPYTYYSKDQLDGFIAAEGANGGKNLFTKDQQSDIALTTETAFQAKEYEWHEYRDHIFYVLDGTTSLEVGGTPGGTHKLRPGEWLAPTCTGAATVAVNKGDMLIIPRGTPHKRTTTGHATFFLIAPRGAVPTT